MCQRPARPSILLLRRCHRTCCGGGAREVPNPFRLAWLAAICVFAKGVLQLASRQQQINLRWSLVGSWQQVKSSVAPVRFGSVAVLVAPYRAILFWGGQHSPKMVRYPPLALSFTQAHLCDTPFCNVSRDSCSIPHKNKHERVLRYYRYKYREI